MIFVLTEQHMNGTVTMNTMVVGVDAKDFKTAVSKVKAMGNVHRATIHLEDDRQLYYSIPGHCPVVGNMRCEPLKIL